MNMDEPTNLEILKVPTADGFLDELEAAPETLHYSQGREFFNILLAYFRTGIDEETGNLILTTIAKVLCNDRHLSTFVTENFVIDLPFKQRAFIDGVFEVLFVLVTLDPLSFDNNKEVAQLIASSTKKNPKKVLTILALFCEKFGDAEYPWSMSDILIQEAHRFTGPDLAPNYVALVTNLCLKYKDFCQGRAKHCWKKICALLEETDILTLKVIYCGLCNIAKVYNEGALPIDQIRTHLRVKELQRPALSLLLTQPLAGEDCCDRPLLQIICSLAERDDKATLVLMKSARDPVFADFLIDNANFWLCKELPTVVETLRLFLVVFNHKELRQALAETPEFVEFLKLATEQENSGTLSMICTILRRIEITEDLVHRLSDSGFLRAFFAMSCELKSSTATHSALLMLDTIAKVTYTREFMKMCEVVNSIITEKSELSEVATLVAAQLCEYKKCALAFKRKRLDDYLRTQLNDEAMKKPAKRFLDAIADVTL